MQSGTGTGFLHVLHFPPPIFISQNDPFLGHIIWGWYNGELMASVPGDFVSLHPKNKKV
jgi:hypothetical protein